LVSGLLMQPGTLHARWLVIELADGRERLLPRSSATQNQAHRLVVPYSVEIVASAPDVEDGKLTVEQASRLALHYGWTLDGERTDGEPADG